MFRKSFFLTILILLSSLSLFAQSVALKGTVKDEIGPIPFATVAIKERGFIVVTDQDGNFIINDVPIGNYVVEVSSMGYKTHNESVKIQNGNEGIDLRILMEEDLQMLEEVVVTGVSRATLIRENPIPVTALSYEELNHNPQTNIVDVLTQTSAGLTVLKTGPNISKPFIRGLGYNRVLTLYDGIRQEGHQWGDEHGLEIDDYNIGCAEVIKGPSSLMFGSDAVAGVISFFSHVPDHFNNKLHGNFISEYHNNNNMIGNSLRLGYNNEKYLFGMSGSHRNGQNYRNAIDGRVYNTNFRVLNYNAVAGVKSDKGHTHLSFTLYDNKQGIPDGSRDPITRQFTKQIYDDELDVMDERPIVTDKELRTYRISDIHTRLQHYRVYLNSHYELPKGDITTNLAWQHNIRREFGNPEEPSESDMFMVLNTYNYDVRYNAPTIESINLDLTAGLNGMWQTNRIKDATEIPIPDYDLLDVGTFIYGKWKKNRWTINGGFRYDFRYESWNDFYIDEESGEQVGKDDPNAHLQFPDFSKNFHDISASIGSTYRISRELSLKASVGRSFRAPNITELASNGLDPGAAIHYKGNRNFKPEVSFQQDLGISASFKDISGEVSLFHNNIDNFIFLEAVEGDDGGPKTDAQGNRFYDYKQSKAEMFGGEAWVEWHPRSIEGLKFYNSIALVYGYNRDKRYKGKGSMGEYLSLIAPLNFRSDLSYEIKLKKNWITTLTPRIDMEYSAKQDRYLGVHGTETMTPSYTLVNLGVSASIPYAKSNNMQLILQANNLFDKSYQAHLSRLKYLEDHDGPGIYNMGRNIIAKLIIPFG